LIIDVLIVVSIFFRASLEQQDRSDVAQRFQNGVAHIGGFNQRCFRNEIAVAECREYERLRSEVESVLGNLAQVTTLLLELFRSRDFPGVHRLDKELELTVGQKERCIGALRQHIKDHNCVPLVEPAQKI
jgi:hypothetical protein